MNLEPFLRSLLLILQLDEFLGPKHLCFIINFNDQSLLHSWNVLEYFGSNYVSMLTCESFQTKPWHQGMTIYVAITPCDAMGEKEWTFWKDNALIMMPDAEKIMPNLAMNLNSKIYHLDVNFSLTEIFKVNALSSSYIQQNIGNVISHYFRRNYDFIWNRRSNLSNLKLEIIYGDYHPMTWKGNNPADVRGLFGELFFSLQEKLQFQYTMHHQEDGVWGAPQANGSYSGFFGKLQKGEMNWSIADTAMTLERSEHFDFTIPFMNQHRRLVTRKPQEVLAYWSYLKVFSTPFWNAVIFSSTVMILCVFLILQINPLYSEDKLHSLATAFSFTTLSLLGRAIFPVDTNLSGKILCLLVLAWGFLIFVSYNAILTSVLASTSVTTINSLEDLLKSKDYTLVMKTDGLIRDYFSRAQENSTEGQLYQKFQKLKPDLKWTKSPIPLDIFTQDAAFLLTEIDIFDTEEKYNMYCEIFIHPGKYYKGSSSSFALQKGSPIKEIMDYQLLKFLESGFLEQLRKKYFQKKQYVCEPPVRELDFKATSLLFVILASGTVAAFLVFMLEKLKILFT